MSVILASFGHMKSIDPKSIPVPELHQYLVSSVAPRPIAFVSSMDKEGNPNLAPYSFFNVFSSNPPTLIFSSNRRVSNNSTKDTLANAEATGELVINVVNHAMTRQMALASIDFPPGINEFEKTGFTPLKSEKVKPFRVAESPVQFECKVKDIIRLGDGGGAGNLVICEVVQFHVSEEIFEENDKISPYKLDLVGRMGRAYYSRAQGDSIFSVFQDMTQIGLGFDGLPAHIRNSKILTGWQLAELAALTALPVGSDVDAVKTDPKVMNILAGNAQERENHLHRYAAELIDARNASKAMAVLMAE
ncbi:MAG: flavin reductase family protein [Bacteroidia bacterium]